MYAIHQVGHPSKFFEIFDTEELALGAAHKAALGRLDYAVFQLVQTHRLTAKVIVKVEFLAADPWLDEPLDAATQAVCDTASDATEPW